MRQLKQLEHYSQKPDNYENDGDEKCQMDQSAQNSASDQTKQPQDQENDTNN
jgi:hypothetical protein